MITKPKPLKPKPCKACKSIFTPEKQLQSVCDWKCAADYAEKLRIKREVSEAKRVRKETKEKLVKIKPLSKWLKEVERHCNKYVRLRDADEPCISCGTTNPNIQYAAGHFRTVKAAPQLRFNLDNIHKQCNFYCNSQLSGNFINYEPRLIKKIGLKRVEALKNNNEIHRYTIEEAKELLSMFRSMCRDLEREQNRKAA